MKLSRDWAQRIRVVMDEWLPPRIRDSRLLAEVGLRLVFRERARVFRDFKLRAHDLSEAEFAAVYRDIQGHTIERETDLNAASLAAIEARTIGPRVLDVGCGKGFLARRLAERFAVTAVDVAPRPEAGFEVVAADVEALPFPAEAFDTVICAHTLEHVRDLPRALAELRRVTARRLIIVVPRQRPYRYTYDLHLHFFPYEHTLRAAFGRGDAEVQDLDGDWLWVEGPTASSSGSAPA